MIIYLCLVFFLIVFGVLLFYKEDNKILNKTVEEKKKIYVIVSFLLLFLVMGFRSLTVGTDTQLYVSIFKNYCNMSWSDILTFKDTFIGFAVFNKLVSMFSTDPHAIIVASSGLICFLTGRFICKNSNHVVYSTLLFILFYHYLNCFNIFRQYIAIMIVINALPLLINQKTIEYILVCLLAMSIHNTAIMALLLFPLSKMRFTKHSIFMFTFFISFATFVVPIAMNKFAYLFPHYQMYFENQYMNYSGYGLFILVGIYIMISLLAFLSKNRMDNDPTAISTDIVNKDRRKFMLLLMINNFAIITNIMSYKYFILYRVSLYYSIYLIIFIPMVFDKYKKNLLLYFMFFLLILVPFVSKLINNDGQVVPYKTDVFSES